MLDEPLDYATCALLTTRPPLNANVVERNLVVHFRIIESFIVFLKINQFLKIKCVYISPNSIHTFRLYNIIY